jgi:mannose-1-phosphate guanylyltransferase
MTAPRITPVILCGGSGTRLWPRSRAATPKPFLPLVGERTMFEEALERCRGEGFDRPVIVAGAAHLQLVDSQLRDVEVGEIIVEPEPRQTAAAVASAALRLPPETVMLVCPSDHHIRDVAAFRTAVHAAASLAQEGWLVCLGIRPEGAETRFGYIRRGESVGADAFRVAEFVEKPDRDAAEAYVSSGEYAWNGGIFAFRAGDYLDELEKHRPLIAGLARDAVAAGRQDGNRFHPDASTFLRIEPESLDYAVMEHTDRAALVMTDMGWSDVGDWQTLHRMRDKDESGNAVRGPAELIGCRNVLVETDGPKVHVLGLEDILVVVDGDDVLVASVSGASQGAKVGRPA